MDIQDVIGSPLAEHQGFRPGDAVGPYELLFPVADGGMATVWAARLRGIRGFRQLVALKLLSRELQPEAEARAMFLDEARTAARIIHPNVVQVFDYGQARGRPYLAMEWIDGESLAAIASARPVSGGRLPLGWVLHVSAAACAGLHAAHEARDDAGERIDLVHRDVTPQNVMVTFDGFTKVVDFGVAKSRRRVQVTRAGVLKGKTGYFSPEQVLGEQVDRRSDLFSFGVLLYVLVTGRHPFRRPSNVETCERIAYGEPMPPRALVPSLPEELNQVILRALAKVPAERFQTAAELQRALDRVAVAAGARIDDRAAGGLVERLFPGAAEQRRARLMRAAAALDACTGEASAPRAPAGGPAGATELMATGREAEAAHVGGGTEADDTDALTTVYAPITVQLREPTRREVARAGGTPGGTSFATPRRRAGNFPLRGLAALALISAGTLVARAAERSEAPAPPQAAAGVGSSALRAAAGARLAALLRPAPEPPMAMQPPPDLHEPDDL